MLRMPLCFRHKTTPGRSLFLRRSCRDINTMRLRTMGGQVMRTRGRAVPIRATDVVALFSFFFSSPPTRLTTTTHGLTFFSSHSKKKKKKKQRVGPGHPGALHAPLAAAAPRRARPRHLPGAAVAGPAQGQAADRRRGRESGGLFERRRRRQRRRRRRRRRSSPLPPTRPAHLGRVASALRA